MIFIAQVVANFSFALNRYFNQVGYSRSTGTSIESRVCDVCIDCGVKVYFSRECSWHKMVVPTVHSVHPVRAVTPLARDGM